jgi:hypothetical protein
MKRLVRIWLLVFLFILPACRPAWQVTLIDSAGQPLLVDYKMLKGLDEVAADIEGERRVLLEHVLYLGGHRVIEQLRVVSEGDGQGDTLENTSVRSFDWSLVAEDAWVVGATKPWKDGYLEIQGESFDAVRLEVEAPTQLLLQATASIIDVAPTAAAALGLPTPDRAKGAILTDISASQVLLVFLDGFGYLRYTEAREAGLIPVIGALPDPLLGLTVYPPCTSVASAALLTGALPEDNGVWRRGIRKTEVATLLDVATAAGLSVVAVEGDALSFNLRNADIQLSGDRDGNGGTDDNVLRNALAVLDEGMPDLFWVHFHGIDDAGHTYGPGAPEEQAKIREVDAAVGQLIDAVPSGTLIILFADHGMHTVVEDGRLGNHGHLIARDMFIPIVMLTKS